MNKSTHPYSNQELFDILTDVAVAYQLKGKGFFEVNAYHNAADAIATLPESVFDLWSKDTTLLDTIPGVGQAIMGKLDFLFTKGRYHPHWLEAFKGIHPATFVFNKINSIGPKTASTLTQNLTFSKSDMTKAIDELIAYAQNNQISTLPKLGQKSQQLILTNALSFQARKAKMPLKTAQDIATKVIAFLKQRFPQLEIQPLGSLRRLSPLVGDIDIAVQSDDPEPILEYFLTFPSSQQTINHGDKKASLRLAHDIRVDLMVQPAASWGSLLQHFTGSKQHNIKLREYALKKNLSLSEYGIKDMTTGQLHQFDNETAFYNFLGLECIPPEKRLGEDEIEKFQSPKHNS